MSVQRVGIVAKEGLTAAAPHLVAVATWLHDRGVETIFEIKTAALAGSRTSRRCRAIASSRRSISLLVLGRRRHACSARRRASAKRDSALRSLE